MSLRKRTLEILSVSAIAVLGFLLAAHHLWPRVAAIGALACACILPVGFVVLAIHSALTDRER